MPLILHGCLIDEKLHNREALNQVFVALKFQSGWYLPQVDVMGYPWAYEFRYPAVYHSRRVVADFVVLNLLKLREDTKEYVQVNLIFNWVYLELSLVEILLKDGYLKRSTFHHGLNFIVVPANGPACIVATHLYLKHEVLILGA